MTGEKAGGVQRRRWRDSVRARIALACGGLFLVVGGALIAATYGLTGHVSNTAELKQVLPGRQFYQTCRELHRAGIPVTPPTSQKCRAAELAAATLGASAQQASDRREFLTYSLTGLAITTLLAGALGWTISGRILAPLRAVTEAARQAAQRRLDQRLALTGPRDELKELADTFDDMLARLDAAFASQRRFVANASHELRTPLTAMRALIEVTLAKPVRSTGQLEALLVKLRAVLRQSDAIITGLLELARSDQGVAVNHQVDLTIAVTGAIDLVGAAAAANRVTITTTLRPAAAAGDPAMIDRLVTNLIDNAVRHNTKGGWARVTTGQEAGQAILTVANSGPEIPADAVPGLFEPFSRLRDRVGDGAGLGLSIVKSVVTAHHGQVDAHPLPGGGLETRIALPAPPASADHHHDPVPGVIQGDQVAARPRR